MLDLPQVSSAISNLHLHGISAPSVLSGWSATAFTHGHAHGLPVAALRVATPLANSKAAGSTVFDTLQAAFLSAGVAGWPVDAPGAAARLGAEKEAGLSRETAVAAMFM